MQKFILVSIILLLSKISCAFETEAQYAILMDYDTKTILFEKDAHTHMAPSSMSKMMTTYIAFETLKSGQIKLSDTYHISEKAWKMGGTRMFIPLDAQVAFEDLLKGLIIQSGNDAAVAIAEILMGTEDEFANYMNQTAKKLGMNNTHFTNASGWPDENNYSCAYDLALLAYHTIKDYPEYYHYYGEKEYTYNGITQGNRNGLLYKDMGADGLKTGHADEAGYGVTASVKKDGRRLIAVVNGLRSNKDRTIAAEQIMNYGMMNFTNVKLADAGQVITKIGVDNGKEQSLELITANNIIIVLSRSEAKDVNTSNDCPQNIRAPLSAGDHICNLKVDTNRYGMLEFPLVAKHSVEEASLFDNIKHKIKKIF